MTLFELIDTQASIRTEMNADVETHIRQNHAWVKLTANVRQVKKTCLVWIFINIDNIITVSEIKATGHKVPITT